MSEIEQQIKKLIAAGEIRISEHGYDELSDDGLSARELVAGMGSAELLEEYADYPKGPCVLFLQNDHAGNPVHAVWGAYSGEDEHLYRSNVNTYFPNAFPALTFTPSVHVPSIPIVVSSSSRL